MELLLGQKMAPPHLDVVFAEVLGETLGGPQPHCEPRTSGASKCRQVDSDVFSARADGKQPAGCGLKQVAGMARMEF